MSFSKWHGKLGGGGVIYETEFGIIGSSIGIGLGWGGTGGCVVSDKVK